MLISKPPLVGHSVLLSQAQSTTPRFLRSPAATSGQAWVSFVPLCGIAVDSSPRLHQVYLPMPFFVYILKSLRS